MIWCYFVLQSPTKSSEHAEGVQRKRSPWSISGPGQGNGCGLGWGVNGMSLAAFSRYLFKTSCSGVVLDMGAKNTLSRPMATLIDSNPIVKNPAGTSYPISTDCLSPMEAHFGLQQDNAPLHTARQTMEGMERHLFQHREWSTQIPDMNIIETVWARIMRQIRLPVFEHCYPTATTRLWHQILINQFSCTVTPKLSHPYTYHICFETHKLPYNHQALWRNHFPLINFHHKIIYLDRSMDYLYNKYYECATELNFEMMTFLLPCFPFLCFAPKWVIVNSVLIWPIARCNFPLFTRNCDSMVAYDHSCNQYCQISWSKSIGKKTIVDLWNALQPNSFSQMPRYLKHFSWWRHQMETFSALLTLCAGNSPVLGPRWIPRTKASDAELWCFLWSESE